MKVNDPVQKEHGVSFHGAQIMDIVQKIVLYVFPTGSSPQTYKRNIQTANFLRQRLNVLRIIDNIDGGGIDLACSASQTLTMESFFCPGQEKDHFSSMPQASAYRTRCSTICSTPRFSTRAERFSVRVVWVLLRTRQNKQPFRFCISPHRPILEQAYNRNHGTNLLQFHASHEHKPRDRTDRWRAHNKRRQLHLVRCVEKFLSPTEAAIVVDSVIGQNSNPSTCVFLKQIK